MLNAISVDVEDYFHPSEVQRRIGVDRWDALDSRVVESTSSVLRLFDRYGVKGTFFVLGWVAERHPGLVADIRARGHEIGCHSYAHQLVYEMGPEEFRRDTERALEAIEKACGVRPKSYRAPSFSITERSMWALRVLAECGIEMDSSIVPISHDRYGIPGFSRVPKLVRTESGAVLEVPVATIELTGFGVMPVGGGGYLRMLPYRYTAAGLRRVNELEGRPGCVYFHPWEVDPKQPRIAEGAVSRMRTYLGLNSMMKKLERLLGDFDFGTMGAVYANQEER